jgi:hypothetical protein
MANIRLKNCETEFLLNFRELHDALKIDGFLARQKKRKNAPTCNPKVHCHVHKIPPLNSVLHKLNPLHSLKSHLHKSRVNILKHPLVHTRVSHQGCIFRRLTIPFLKSEYLEIQGVWDVTCGYPRLVARNWRCRHPHPHQGRYKLKFVCEQANISHVYF